MSEKLAAENANPYEPGADPALPPNFPAPVLDSKGNLVDIVKKTKQSILSIPRIQGLYCSVFETSFANLKIRLVRDFTASGGSGQQLLTQASYLVSFDSRNPRLGSSLLPLRPEDLSNILRMCQFDEYASSVGHGTYETSLNLPAMRKDTTTLLQSFYSQVNVQTVRTTRDGWQLPDSFIPENAPLQVIALFAGHHLNQIHIITEEEAEFFHTYEPHAGSSAKRGFIVNSEGAIRFYESLSQKEIPHPIGATPLFVGSDLVFSSSPAFQNTLENPPYPDYEFELTTQVQGVTLKGRATLDNLEIIKYALHTPQKRTTAPLWLQKDTSDNKWILPHDSLRGHGVLLPKGFRESGVLLGDPGYLSYHAPSATTLQEMHIPIFVAGFYDPGIIPIGGKLILVGDDVVSLIQSSIFVDEKSFPNGLNVNFDDFSHAKAVKKDIQATLEANNLSSYWQVLDYEEYEFTKDIFQQMRSDRNLFSLISIIINIVACSNIVSMLIILVHDKRKEIAILRALGATKTSVGLIFGICGFIMGAVGSLIGALLAWLTLKNLPLLLGVLSSLQGFEVLNSNFYGETITAHLSNYAFWFVLITTSCISTIAGIVPAIKASFVNTSDALRSE